MPNPETPLNFEVLLDVPVKVTVELGACQMAMRDVLQLNSGSVVQLDRIADQPVDLYVNNKKFARGEVVVIEDRLGIRITQVLGAKPSETAGAEERLSLKAAPAPGTKTP